MAERAGVLQTTSGEASNFDPNRQMPPRTDNLSVLMRRKGKAQQGEVLNFCEFGCPDDELDGNGYCHHLVGFSKDKKEFEPLVDVGGGDRQIVVPHDKILLKGFEKPDAKGNRERRWKWGPPKLEKCVKGDRFVRTTSEWRVYRDMPKPEVEDMDEAELEAATKP